MTSSEQDIASFRLWDGSSWEVRGWRGIRNWVQTVYDFWTPFINASVSSDPANVRGSVGGRMNTINNRIDDAIKSGATPKDFESEIANLFAQSWGPCHPESELGQIMIDLSDAFGAESALFAYAIARGHVPPASAQTIEHVRGMFAIAFPGWSGQAAGQRRLATERKNYREATARQSQALDRAEREREERWAALVEQTSSGMVGWARRRSKAWRDTRSRWAAQREHLVAGLEALESTYKEKLALMAPVDYWKSKARRHQDAEFWARLFVILFFAISTPATVAMFGFAAWYLLRFPTENHHAGLYIIVSAGLATSTGIILWAGRLLTKLYLSQHHLRQDAEERAVMTTTYLALTSEKAADDADRSIILNALFRPTSDGIIKEDGGLDASLASLLSRIAARP